MMQRKPGFPVANCSIKMPDNLSVAEPSCEEDGELQQRRLQLINFGHSQWGFNNWSWSVTKQELDFADVTNGKYCAGVVAFVSISVKNLDIHRENIGYATSMANNKGFAIYKSRKVAVTNALRETLLSFGGTVATELMELLETSRDIHCEPQLENNQNIANTNIVPAKLAHSIITSTNLANLNITGIVNTNHASVPNTNHAIIANTNHASIANTNHASIANTNHASPKLASNVKPLEGPPLIKNVKKEIDAPANIPQAPVKNAAPIAKAHPMPANVPPARLPAPRPLQPAQQNLHPAHPRPNSNEGAKLENTSEEEARAERKRRQRLAQEEFRLKQLGKQGNIDDRPESSFDKLLMEIPTQDIVIEETGASSSKRKSQSPETSAKRRAGISKLDILHD